MAYTKIPGDLIETGAITGDVLADGGIATAKLANDAVTTDKILDANITHAKLHTSMDLTGKTVTVATAAGSTNTTAAASTAFVQQELTTLIGGAPGTLDTLNELAAAINDDANYNSTLTTALATKLPLAGGTLTGDITLTNDKDIHFLTNSGSNDGTMITRASGDALRIKYATNVLIFDAVDNFATRFYNSNGVAALEILPNATAADSKVKVNNGNFIVPLGNVGIGTSSPSQTFTVEKNSGIFRINTSTSTYPRIEVGSSSGTTAAIINRTTGSQNIIFGETSDTGNYVFRGGNVGIGTASPSANLEITQSGNNVGLLVAGGGYNYTAKFESVDAEANIIIEDNNSTNDGNMIGVATNDMYFITDTAERLRIDSSGNVGINRTSISQPSGGATTLAIQGTDNNKAGAIRLYSANDSVSAYIYPDSVNGLSINTSTSHPMVFRTAATERMRIMSDGQIRIGSGSAQRPIIQATNFGYSASYRVALLGSASNAYNTQGTGSVTLAMNYDPSGNSDSSFGGDGREILFRNGTQFVTPNDADNDFNLYNLVLKDGTVGIGTSSPSNKLSIKGGGNTWPTSPSIKLWDSQYSKGWYVGTANNQDQGDFYIRTVTSEGAYPVAGNKQFTLKHDGSLCLGSLTSDSSASMGGQTPKLYVNGYTSLDGLRIAGSDGGNTIYRNGGTVSVVSANHSVDIKGTTVNLQAGGQQIFRAATNRWSLGGGTYGHGRVRSYHYHASLSAGQTVALLQNQSAHTDVNFIYWIEAFHSSRSYRTGMGTFGGYGMHKSSASNGGLDIYGTSVSAGIMRLDIAANSSYATSYHISMMIFGDSGITVHNGTMSDQIA